MATPGPLGRSHQSRRGKTGPRKQPNGGNGGRGAPASRTSATRVLAQGTGAVTRSAFPLVKAKAYTRAQLIRHGFNALSPIHLALPRPVGPYMVVRLTKVINSSAKVILFGSVATSEGTNNAEPTWSSTIAIEDVDPTLAMNATNNAYQHCMDVSNFGIAMTWVPSAITVQIMNPNPISTTSGIVYGGRCKTQLPLANTTRTWNTFADQLIQFQAPRLMSAGKLALRGVAANCLPLDMSDLADFRPYQPSTDGAFTWDGGAASVADSNQFAGFSPLFVVNGGAPDLTLDYLVTAEYRLRFDPGTIACAGHAYHTPGPSGIWEDAIRAGSQTASAFEDIADRVANVGEAAASVLGVAALLA